MQRHFTIYKTTNVTNNNEYTGKHITTDPNDNYLGSGKYLKRAIEKYGEGQFKKEVLFIFDNEEEMNSKEAELVNEEYIARDDTYNICVGGKGGFSYINANKLNANVGSFAKDINASKEASKLGIKKQQWLAENDPDWVAKRAKNKSIAALKRFASGEKGTFTGKKHTEETIAKMRVAHKVTGHARGERNSQYGTMWITNDRENNKIKRTDPIPEGWRKGRVIK